MPCASVRRFFPVQLPVLFLLCLTLTACAAKNDPQSSGLESERAALLAHYPAPSSADASATYKVLNAQEVFELDDGDLDFTEELAQEPSVYPTLTLIKPTSGDTIGSPFGMRRHPTKRKNLLHAGVDIAGNRGERVVASAPGKVLFSGRKGAYGLTIDIDAGNGVTLRYAHLDKLVAKEGARVKRGQYIGNLGRTGRVTAAHLHFEVRLKNKPVNPMQFIAPEHRWAVNTAGSERSKSRRSSRGRL
ncbi:MAG: M23 family metallopeptidase [Bilophila sp.]